MSKLTQYGGTCNIIRNGSSVYNPITNAYESTPTVITGKGLKCDYSIGNIDGTVIQVGDVRIMACFNNGTPTVNDVIDFEGTIYNVVNVTELNPNSKTPIYYNLQCRK